MDKEAFYTAMRFFERSPKKRRRIILLGDILDMEFLHAKSESFKRARKNKDFDGYFQPEVEKEWLWWAAFYKEIREYVYEDSHIWYVSGNHESRVNRDVFTKFMMHDYAHWFDLESRIKEVAPGITFVEYNDWLRISTTSGNLMLTHGIYCGANPIKKHADVAKCSVMFGHTHERGVVSFKTVEGTFMGYNNPCLCGTQPKYMEGRPHNWSVGFSTITVTNENFWVNQHTVIDGVLYDANGRKI